jgi:hypothetical protein
VLVQYYFIRPFRSFALKLHDLPFSLTFLGCQVFATWLVTKRKGTEDSLRQANVHGRFPASLELLRAYDWPWNVRELQTSLSDPSF